MFFIDSILPSGAYVTLYMRDCSHYEMMENGVYHVVFPQQYI